MTAGADRWRSVVVAGATLLGVLLVGRLGLWQLDRAAEKQVLQATLQARGQLPTLEARALPRSAEQAEPMQYRRVRVQGRWLAETTVYLDNRQMNGKPGFFVLTPLKLPGEAGAVLVQRGWIPRHSQERTVLRDVNTPAGNVVVAGVIAPAPSRLFEFSQSGVGPIRQNLDMGAFAAEIGQPLLPFSILQGDAPEVPGDGLLRDWPRPGIDIHKNYGYALQWFSLGALMTGLYVWFQHLRPRRDRKA
ncbi:MAG: SURF1 family protein [Rhizobacter sp.]|nr:SURF1 family protein [Rhizobacter sp.]